MADLARNNNDPFPGDNPRRPQAANPNPAASASPSPTSSLLSRFRSILLTLGSLLLTVFVFANAFVQRKQFYPAVVYITKSNPRWEICSVNTDSAFYDTRSFYSSLAVLYVQAFVLVILFGKLMRKVFFGRLRAAEFEHLMERSWYAVTETCLAFTVFK